MIFGIGTDICQISRIQKVYDKYGVRLVQRILTPAEQQIWQQRQAKNSKRGVQFLASQFSAKEAFSKAIGLGMRSPMSWQNCAVLRAPSGQPQLQLHNELQQWFEQRQLSAYISMSDETDYVVSFAVVEQQSKD